MKALIIATLLSMSFVAHADLHCTAAQGSDTLDVKELVTRVTMIGADFSTPEGSVHFQGFPIENEDQGLSSTTYDLGDNNKLVVSLVEDLHAPHCGRCAAPFTTKTIA